MLPVSLSMNKKKLLIIGPGFGGNTLGLFNSLQNNSCFDVTFLGTRLDPTFVERFPEVEMIPFSVRIDKNHPFRTLRNFLKLVKFLLFRRHVDVLYVLGLGGIMIAPLFFLAKRKTLKVFEIWSNSILDTAKNKDLFGRADYYILKKADYISQYWWSIKEQLDISFPEFSNKFLLFPLRHSNNRFTRVSHRPESVFVRELMSRIPDEQIVCFWPRSIIPSNNHVLCLEALSLIKRRNPYLMDGFKLYIWGGNIDNADCRQKLDDAIKRLSLSANVEVINHPFVPINDIYALEERSDFFIQISHDDVLSSFIFDMIYSGKPFVLSNLRTFQFLNEIYDLQIPLVDNTQEAIADSIENILINHELSLDIYKRRIDICRLHFSMDITRPWYEIVFEKLSEMEMNRL